MSRWIDLVAIVLCVVLSYLAMFRNSARAASDGRLPAPFDPCRPYQVYCHDFDVEVEAGKLDAVLAAASAVDGDRPNCSVEDGQLAAFENDLAARSASREPALREAATRIRAVTGQGVLNDAVVSLLIDHSGSMRGQPILFAAQAAMGVSFLLDRLGVKHEVLGFTTVHWRGGKSRETWLRDGKPLDPGRLNDLLHIVYCSAGNRLDARHCAMMLRKGLLKENIDGEAVEWAASRLRGYEQSRKYLIVLSDGAPVDDSTLAQNDGAYMERHLLSVIDGIAQAGDIQLAAIGIAHDVGRYYPHSITITAPSELDGAVLQVIEQLLCQPPAADPGWRREAAAAPARPQTVKALLAASGRTGKVLPSLPVEPPVADRNATLEEMAVTASDQTSVPETSFEPVRVGPQTTKLPSGLTAPALLAAGARNLKALPSRLTCGRIDASNCTSLATVGGHLVADELNVSGTAIEELPDDLRVALRLEANQCKHLKRLPAGLKVGVLSLRDCPALTSLPSGLEVSFLDVSGCVSLETLPDDLRVQGGWLRVRDCPRLRRLPEGVGRLAQLDIAGCRNITRLPDGLVVSSWIDIGGSGLTALPPHLAGVGLRWRGLPIDERVAFRPETLSREELQTYLSMMRRQRDA
jgi:cobaltochelatase CobT